MTDGDSQVSLKTIFYAPFFSHTHYILVVCIYNVVDMRDTESIGDGTRERSLSYYLFSREKYFPYSEYLSLTFNWAGVVLL